MPRALNRIVLSLALVAASAGARAQPLPPAWNPHTGDAWVDRQLDDINRYGQRYRDAFIDELARYHSAPRGLVGGLLDQHWAPGNVYFACALAQVAGQPCRAVAEAWSRDPDLGWAGVMQRLRIRADSPQFHRLKHALVASYDHWARPIRIDASLHSEFPQHAMDAGTAEAPAPGDRPPTPSRVQR